MILRFLRDTFARLRKDQRGNIYILFAATSVPLLLIMGGAVDFARYERYKTELANAVDSAALALARQGEDYTEAQATTYVTNYVNALAIGDGDVTVEGFDVTKTEDGYIVRANGAMATAFLPLGALTKGGHGIMSIDLNILAEVVHATNRVELALVLDNTGSMNCGSTVSSSCTGNWQNPGSSSRISGLKTAAHSLIDILMTPALTAANQIQIAVVPFEGTVNTGASPDSPPSWLDWQDTPQAAWNSANFDDLTTQVENGQDCTTHHYYYYTWTTCQPHYDTVTQEVSHKWLFDQMHAKSSSVKWEGCVEMRAAPYDILDTTPDASNPDTLFVPFLWPDERDSSYYYQNNYMSDQTSGSDEDKQRYVGKYQTSTINWNGTPDTTFPFTSGPNYGCPRPVLPLTNDKTSVEDAIDAMIAYPAMGTYIPTGLVWGWHALSSTEPLTQGVGPSDDNYDVTIKAIVLLSDGENSVTGTSNFNDSIFSAYNYVNTTVDGNHRLGSSASSAQTALNNKTSALCTNVKNADIRLYTITFGDIPSSAEDLMRNCASVVDGETLYYHAPSNAELDNIFETIGKDLSKIHLSM